MSSTRAAGLFLLLTAVATAVSVMTRLSSSMEPLAGSPIQVPIILDTGQYVISGAARILSGLALLAAAVCLWAALRRTQPRIVGVAAALLKLSGAATAISGVCMLALAAGIGGAFGSDTAVLVAVPGWVEPVDAGRWITGKVGFALAGLGLIALGLVQWRMGGIRKISAIVGVIIGIAMLFIWVDAATVVHRISGIAFLIWLIVSGIWLTLGLMQPARR